MRVIFLEETDSTNAEALRRWKSPRSDSHRPFAIVAERQTEGRGRRNREWESPRGGLWFSAAWPMARPVADYQEVPVLAGAVLSSLLESDCNLHPLVKWPNDVLIDDAKLAGILCQAEASINRPVLIVGIGVNGNYPAAALSQKMRYPAATLMEKTGRRVDLRRLAERLAVRLEDALAFFEGEGLAPWLRYLNEHLAWKDERVACHDSNGGGSLEGRIEGIDERGRLLLLVDGRLRHLSQGELERLRPV